MDVLDTGVIVGVDGKPLGITVGIDSSSDVASSIVEYELAKMDWFVLGETGVEIGTSKVRCV